MLVYQKCTDAYVELPPAFSVCMSCLHIDLATTVLLNALARAGAHGHVQFSLF